MSPSEICGLPHLIRLAVFHDEFMQETDWDQPTIEYVRKKVQYLVDYLGSEISLDMHFNVDIDYVLAEGVGGAEVAEENEEPDEEVADENEAFHAEVAEEDEALHAEVAEEDEELHEQVTDEDETLHAEIADENEAPEANAL